MTLEKALVFWLMWVFYSAFIIPALGVVIARLGLWPWPKWPPEDR